jgi:opacity protein-like surface antigen
MSSSFRSLIAGALLLVSGLSDAKAADLGPDRGLGYAPAAIAPTASWYVRGDVGYAWMDANDLVANSFTFSSVSVDNTWGLGVGIGTYFGAGVRGDLTYEWRASTDVHATGVAVADFELDTQVLLANLYYDFRPFAHVTPYIGIGVGAAFHSTSSGTVTTTCGGTCNFDGENKWTPAAALMAGLSFRLDRQAPVSIKDSSVAATVPGRLHFDVGYRFLYLGDASTGHAVGVAAPTPGPRLEDITAHEFRIGLRYDLR